MRTLKLTLVAVFCFGIILISGGFKPITAVLADDQSKQDKAARSRTNPTQPVKTNNNSVKTRASPDDYVGSESCGQCHADQMAFYSASAHRKTMGKDFTFDRRGCEACHGGARKHTELHLAVAKLYQEGKIDEAQALYADEGKMAAARLRKFTTISAAEVTATCLGCHEGTQGKSEERFNFRRSEHARHGLSCIDCHSSHTPKRTEFLLKETQPGICYTCHADQKASFAKMFHHKVPEGGMKCTDCHNQHGGFQSKQLRSWVGDDVTCLKCHADKAGPFVYEHAPVKTEGCQACHTPHGSNNPRLLTRSDVRFLCLECHSNTPGIPAEGTGIGPPTPSFHNVATARFQNCTVCHSMIHGSNTSRTYFR